jgi:glycosyltransferase involved in cell wall biosynthesis
VDRERFHPAAPDPRIRAALGLAPQHRVVGIVARVQRRRRFELLLEAARYLFQADPSARLLLVGRGTHRRELAEEPARRLGIADRVVFAGYRTADYADVLRSIDLFTFLVPGSDGTCRALLEAASCGIPAVVTRRGALPEIVVDGVSGLVVDEEPEALAAGWRRLLQEPELRHALGEGARRRAELEFDPRRLADQVGSFYARVAS